LPGKVCPNSNQQATAEHLKDAFIANQYKLADLLSLTYLGMRWSISAAKMTTAHMTINNMTEYLFLSSIIYTVTPVYDEI
jgi:hypothetical protein